MKHQIRHSVRTRIIIFIFLLVLSLTMIYILTRPQNTTYNAQSSPKITQQVVPGLLVLKVGTTVPFANGEAEITLLESNTMPENCADCMERARATVTKAGESREIEFIFGGIVGFNKDTDKAFDYVFMIRELKTGEITLEYEKADVSNEPGES